MHSGWMENRRAAERNAQNIDNIQRVYSRSSLYQTTSRVCMSDERRFLYIIRNSAAPSGVCASSRFSRITIASLLFLRLPYPCPLRLESCSHKFLHECKRRPGRLYELFQFTSTNCRSFLRFLLFSLSLSLFLPLASVSSSFFHPFPSSRLRVRGHKPYRGNSTFVFVFRRRRWQSRKNRQDGRNSGKEKCREVNEKVTYIFAISINTRLIIIENTAKKGHAFLTKSYKFPYL